eukprot:285938-Pelagomonas_calceolata.AAC.5
MKLGGPQITLLASDYPRRAHSSTLGPFLFPKEVQRVTGFFRSARKPLTNLSGLPDLPFKNLGFGVLKKSQAGGVSPRPGVRV